MGDLDVMESGVYCGGCGKGESVTGMRRGGGTIGWGEGGGNGRRGGREWEEGGDLDLRVWRRLWGSHELQPLLRIPLKRMLAG